MVKVVQTEDLRGPRPTVSTAPRTLPKKNYADSSKWPEQPKGQFMYFQLLRQKRFEYVQATSGTKSSYLRRIVAPQVSNTSLYPGQLLDNLTCFTIGISPVSS